MFGGGSSGPNMTLFWVCAVGTWELSCTEQKRKKIKKKMF